MNRWKLMLFGCLLSSVTGIALADEGMWTLDNLPVKKMQQDYGFTPTQQWVDRIRRSTVRLAGGCSGSFVSADGLVMTNHHCANSCLSQISTPEKNYMSESFGATSREKEIKCPSDEINQLDSISDVTAKVNAAIKGKQGAARIAAERAISSELEQACVANAPQKWRCDMVSLYHGGRYAMYKYRRYQDVRLVFAPEQSIAFFGGDPDNFNFPRYALDVTFFRVYENGKPAKTRDFLKFRAEGPDAGEMTFVVGNPGSTSRETPWIQLSNMRENTYVFSIGMLSELRGLLWQYSRNGEQQAKEAQNLLFSLDNGLKVYKGRLAALNNAAFVERKQTEDEELRAWMSATSARKAKFGDPWTMLEKAQARGKLLQDRLSMILSGAGFGIGTELYGDAITLVRGASQRAKPDAERLASYRQANLPALEKSLMADVPVYPAYEQMLMAWSMEKMRQLLGADDAFVKQILGNQSTEQLAEELVKGTKLADPAVRKKLWEGGAPAIAASNDPLIVLARRVEPIAEQLRQQYENEVSAPTSQANEMLAKARFERDGTSHYPDATFSPRLSYGKVLGWQEGDHDVAPFTQISGLYQRATGADPYQLPESWVKAKNVLDLSVPMNVVTTNDIIGGNSGSPLIDRQGRAVGLIFDGNIHSIAGDFFYDESNNRAVSVDAAVMMEAIRKVYRLPHLADELNKGHL